MTTTIATARLYWALCTAWAMLLKTVDVTPTQTQDSSPISRRITRECFQPEQWSWDWAAEEAPKGRGIRASP